MKALLIVLLLVLYLKGSLSTSTPPFEPAESVVCYECMQPGSYKCENGKLCNSSKGFCHMVVYEGKDGEKNVRQSCASDCELPTPLFIDARMYHALCCTFHFCNQLHYSMEVSTYFSNIAVSGFTASFFWTYFRIILQYIGLED